MKAYGEGIEPGTAKDGYVSFYIDALDETSQVDIIKSLGSRFHIRIMYMRARSEVPCSIYDKKNGTYRISYRRDRDGEYMISANIISRKDAVAPVKGSPFKVMVNSDFALPDTNAKDHQLHCMDPDRTIIDFSKLALEDEQASTYSFLIETKNWKSGPIKEGGAQFVVRMNLVAEKTAVPTTLVDNKDGTYSVTFPLPKSGKHKVEIGLLDFNKNFRHIKGSPRDLMFSTVNDKNVLDHTQTSPNWAPLEKRNVGDVIKLTIEARDKGGNLMGSGGAKLVARVLAQNKKELTTTIIDHENGQYSVNFKAKYAGLTALHLSVLREDETLDPLAGCPRNFYITPSALDVDPEQTSISGPGIESANTGKFTSFMIDPRNKMGQVVPESSSDFQVRIIFGPGFKEENPAVLRDNNDGTYNIMYCPSYHGPHKVMVKWVDSHGIGHHVKNSPATFDVFPSANVPWAKFCKAYGAGLENPESSRENIFFVQACNFGDQQIATKIKDFTVRITSDNNIITTEVVELEDGTLRVAYFADNAGKYNVQVMLSENDNTILDSEEARLIHGMPKIIDVEESVSVTRTTVLGLESHREFVTLPTVFKIEPKDPSGQTVFSGDLHFDITITHKERDTERPPAVWMNDGTYNVEFDPQHTGKYQIKVNYQGRPLTGSPFEIDVQEAADSEQSATLKYMFMVQARTKSGAAKARGGDEFEVEITGPEGITVEDIHITDVGDGTYLVSYSLDVSGEYWVKASLNGKLIKGFPWVQVI